MRKLYYIASSLMLSVALLAGCTKTPTVEPEPNIDVNAGSNVEYGTFKVVNYNILQGMVADKGNNYDNFVAWVKEQDPDVLALEECNGFSETSLGALAKRWGHEYAVLNPNNSGYTVGLTSRYPIEDVVRMLDYPDGARGAIHAKINGINFVVLHLYPFSTWPQNVGASGTGEDYRLSEITTYLDNTIRQYPEEPSWLMMGDFNSPSPYDKANTAGTWEYRAQNEVLNSGYFDLVHEAHSAFQSSTTGGTRIDYIFGSKAMASNVVSARILKDDFTLSGVSDHYPVCAVFRIKK